MLKIVIFLNNVERELVQSALYNYFIDLNSNILYKYLKGDILAIEVKRFNWAADSKDFQINDFIDKFKNVILHIDYKTNLI